MIVAVHVGGDGLKNFGTKLRKEICNWIKNDIIKKENQPE